MRRIPFAVMRRLAILLRSADTFWEIACVLDTFVGDAVELRGFGVEVRGADLVPLAGATNFLSKASIDLYWRSGYARDPLPACIAAAERAVSYAEVMSPEALALENERHGVDARLDLEPDQLWGAPIAGLGELGGIFRAVSWEAPSRAWLRDIETVGRMLAIRYAQLGLTPHPPSLTRLTPRQLEVVRFLARGYTNAEIGCALGISDNTVKKQLKLVFADMDVSNRAELAARVGRAFSYGDPAVLPVGCAYAER